jgi:hypothetical protein
MASILNEDQGGVPVEDTRRQASGSITHNDRRTCIDGRLYKLETTIVATVYGHIHIARFNPPGIVADRTDRALAVAPNFDGTADGGEYGIE